MIGDWRIAIIGAGMGGLTAAAAFSQFGASVNIFEQADKFSRIGAGIQMSPNAMKVLYGLGLEKQVCNVASGAPALTIFAAATGQSGPPSQAGSRPSAGHCGAVLC